MGDVGEGKKKSVFAAFLLVVTHFMYMLIQVSYNLGKHPFSHPFIHIYGVPVVYHAPL